MHTFAVSTVTTALLTNTQARNAIGRQTFSADLYNREQIYSISDRIWDQTGEKKKRKKKHGGKKEQKNVEGNPINIKTIVLCTRISLQTFVFIGSVQKLNYVKNKYTIFEWWRAVGNIVENKIYVFIDLLLFVFTSLVYFWKNVFHAKKITSPNGFHFFFQTTIRNISIRRRSIY